MRIVKFLSETRLDPAMTSVALRLIGLSLMAYALYHLAGVGFAATVTFTTGLMMWSEGMLPRRKDGP